MSRMRTECEQCMVGPEDLEQIIEILPEMVLLLTVATRTKLVARPPINCYGCKLEYQTINHQF